MTHIFLERYELVPVIVTCVEEIVNTTSVRVLLLTRQWGGGGGVGGRRGKTSNFYSKIPSPLFSLRSFSPQPSVAINIKDGGYNFIKIAIALHAKGCKVIRDFANKWVRMNAGIGRACTRSLKGECCFRQPLSLLLF